MPTTTLAVDLDHTLINTDLLQQSLYRLVRQSPYNLLKVPFWLLKGKAHLKHRLAERIRIDVRSLPYNKKVLAYIDQRKKNGDLIVLATASHQVYAQQVADFLDCFDRVLATDNTLNLSSHHKAKRLVTLYQKGGFDYIGDHKRDIPVWQASRLAILVNTTAYVEKKIAQLNIKTLKL